MVSLRAPGYANISCNNYNIIRTISRHIQNLGIFNVWDIFKTLSKVYDEPYWEFWRCQSGLFRHFQGYSGTFSNIQKCPEIMRDIKSYSGIIEAYESYSDIFKTLCKHGIYEACHIQNPGTFRTRGIFKSLSNMQNDQVYSESWHSQNSLFQHFQGYLGIFSNIEVCLPILIGAQLGKVGEVSPTHFWRSKKVPSFWRKGLDSAHLRIKCSIQNVIFGASRRKNPKVFPQLAFLFLSVFNEIFIEVPLFHETSPALKNLFLSACTQALFF